MRPDGKELEDLCFSEVAILSRGKGSHHGKGPWLMKVKLSGSGLDLHWLHLVTLKGLAILGLFPHRQREEADRVVILLWR